MCALQVSMASPSTATKEYFVLDAFVSNPSCRSVRHSKAATFGRTHVSHMPGHCLSTSLPSWTKPHKDFSLVQVGGSVTPLHTSRHLPHVAGQLARMSMVSSPTLKGSLSHWSAKSAHSVGSSLKLHRNPVVTVDVCDVVAEVAAVVVALVVCVEVWDVVKQSVVLVPLGLIRYRPMISPRRRESRSHAFSFATNGKPSVSSHFTPSTFASFPSLIAAFSHASALFVCPSTICSKWPSVSCS